MPFQPNDKVRKKDGSRVGGLVEHTGCIGTTTAGGKTCSKKNCPHNPKDYLFVRWPDGILTSGNEAEFDLEAGQANEAVPDLTADELLKRAEEAVAKKKAEEALIKAAEDKMKAEKFDWDAYYGLQKGMSKNLPKVGI